MCCICGGGSTAEQPAACADTSYGAGDVGGDGCDWYAANPSACGSYDTPDFSAGDMCCACGGGSKGGDGDDGTTPDEEEDENDGEMTPEEHFDMYNTMKEGDSANVLCLEEFQAAFITLCY